MKEGWECKKLSDVGTVVTGSTPSTKDADNYNSCDVCFVKPSDIPKDGIGILSDTEFHISNKAYDKSRKLPIGSVLTTCIGIVGKVGILKVEATCNQQINAIIPNTNIVPSFLAYSILSKKQSLEKTANAPVVPIINKKDFSNTTILVPPLSEQQHIVEELDLLSSIIEKKKAQLNELDNLAQSLFYEMFGENSYEKVTLEEVVEITSSLVSPLEPPYADMLHVSPSNSISNTGDIVDCIRAKEEKLISGKYTFTKGMVLYSKIRPNLNKVAIPTFDGICSADMYPLSVKEKATNIFVWRLLLSKDFLDYAIKQSGRARMPKLNREALFSYSFSLPPLSLQHQFAEKMQALEYQKELIKQSIKEVETLFNSRMDYYFN